MLTLHYLEGSRAHRILWLLEELGTPYQLTIYPRDAKSGLAPPELKKIHPLGKSPVITDGDNVVAESGAIIEYLIEQYGQGAQSIHADLAYLEPARGTPAYRQCRFWMHYAEGSLMNWLVMGLVFQRIPSQPMPFFVRPIAKALCRAVTQKLIRPNINDALVMMEQHLQKNLWFAGDHLTMADFQMGFAVEAALLSLDHAQGKNLDQPYPQLKQYRQRIQARKAYQQAVHLAGPLFSN